MAISAGLPAPARPPVSAMEKPIRIGSPSCARAPSDQPDAAAMATAPATMALARSIFRRVALLADILIIFLPP